MLPTLNSSTSTSSIAHREGTQSGGLRSFFVRLPPVSAPLFDVRSISQNRGMTEFALNPDDFIHGDEESAGPLIQVVVALTAPDMNELSYAGALDYAKRSFDTIRQLGGRPRLVDSASASVDQVPSIADAADAVLFLGGGDVDPDCYGYTGPEPKGLYGIDRRADEFCIALFHACVSRDLPTLAFCRGSQLLNVAFGGTLIPDIEDWQIHRGPGGAALMIDEAVTLDADSHIARMLGKTAAVVRNGHHQAVDRVGDALRPVAFAADGIVEGTQHKTATWMLGVQWHPEDPNANPEDRQLVFAELVERARRSA